MVPLNLQVPLADQFVDAPRCYDRKRADRELAALAAVAAADASLQALALCILRPQVVAVLEGVFGASPYLTRLIVRYPHYLQRCLTAPLSTLTQNLADELRTSVQQEASRGAVARALRLYKTQVAMLVALADLGGVWPVMTVTRLLSDAADAAVEVAVAHLFQDALRRGDWLDSGSAPEQRSGYFVLAVGKHGAFELNYSSDIDLVIFYDASQSRLSPTRELQTFFVRLTRDLVKLLQEPTEDGYVFRTDLRLRPDPGSTAVALSTSAALNYYESVGQNWERAALIKARVIAGDRSAGGRFLADLAPFIWRQNLDFAAIADIAAMKRQINAVRGFGTIAVAGHNIKVGRGGIREVEFFTQTQQLIAGGRQPELRVRDTLGALEVLSARNWIASEVRDQLSEAYVFLRRIEHRLQMVADEQTQTLPNDDDALEALAAFSGFASLADFSMHLRSQLATVQQHYSRLFEASPALTAVGRDMVFTGPNDDPATLAALIAMGFTSPAIVLEGVRGWHHGRARAVRSERARELLTEVQPRLMEALAATVNPDQAFAGFDRFLGELPSGVQLFALLKQHPALLDLVATIMGTAPRLASVLGHRRRVLDAVLDPGFFGEVAPPAVLETIVSTALSRPLSFEQLLDHARVVGSEQAFLIGVRVLTGTIDAASAGLAYAALADELIKALTACVGEEMQRLHGKVAGGAAAVLALGKLGGREMTASSDLDLIVVYDFDSSSDASSGQRPLAPPQYYARFTQRLIGAFNAPTTEGPLYDIDLRLRPSGQKGPVATQLSSFRAYQATEAWTWEHMALTRARVVAAPDDLRRTLETVIAEILCRPRDRTRIAVDVRSMRERIVSAKGSLDMWDLKQVRGGLVDIEFITQFLQLVHAAERPDVLHQNTEIALQRLTDAGFLGRAASETLRSAARRLNNLTQVLRLCVLDAFEPASAPDGLRRLLAQVGGAPTFDILVTDLAEQHSNVAVLFDELII